MASGDAFEYKYVIIMADGEVRWESAIENRMYMPEGGSVVLEDGLFNDKRPQTVKSAPAQATTVNFRVSVATNVGERVVAVGSCTPLGMWEPQNGLELYTTNAVFPLWQAQILKSQYVVTFYCQCLCGSRT